MTSNLIPPSRQPPIFHRALAIKTEGFAGHNEVRDALVFSLAGVTAIMLIANLLLLILYWDRLLKQQSCNEITPPVKRSPEFELDVVHHLPRGGAESRWKTTPNSLGMSQAVAPSARGGSTKKKRSTTRSRTHFQHPIPFQSNSRPRRLRVERRSLQLMGPLREERHGMV
jgi:hypothetical protein